MARQYDRKLILEDGSEYYGYGFGDRGECVAEVVFNTAMVGYQELISDPTYTDLAVVMTYPLIGNYGIADEDFEGKSMSASALIVNEYNDQPSNFRYTKTLSELMEENHIVGIEGIDTRALTRVLRDRGNMRGIITDADTAAADALARLAAAPVPTDAVARVSCRKRWYSRTPDHRLNVVVVDCGTRLSVIRALNAHGCNVTVVPYDATAEEVLATKPDGIFIGDGPGDPADVGTVIELIRALRGKLPICGSCLGHLLIARAYGAKTVKLACARHGANHPVKELATGKVAVTSRGQGYTVDEASLAGTGLTVTHRSVLDGSVEGLACPADKVYTVQFRPENPAGVQGSSYLIDQFIKEMTEAKNNA